MKVDPITFAVIKSGLDSIADDMAYTVVRIARSEIVKDVMDFSAALCAGDGQMVAAGQDHCPAPRCDPRGDGVGAREVRGRSS